ncbi:MAG: SPFH domain-containing protein, partial [Bacteroidales bacterium]|nr:SPFH domain-containing protein [Bacteroidales bacterium]
MKKEKSYSPASGYLALVVVLLLIILPILSMVYIKLFWMAIILLFGLVGIGGFVIVNPNESSVLVLFGAYKGTIKKNGFFWVNPFFTKKKISLRALNLDSEPIKVNDKIGNPIMIGIVLVWKVENTYKAAFDVDNYSHFVDIQSEAAIRKLA